ncbi:phage tail domain-containing protein [Latilactobacillus sakei]
MGNITSFGSTILIQRLNGKIIDLGKLGFRVKSFNVPSAAYSHTFQQVGKYGSLLVNTEVQQLSIPLVFDIIATDNYDYELQKLEVNRIFRSDEEFYVINTRIPYLRWKVVAEQLQMPQDGNFWRASNISVNLVCSDGYAETTATTLAPFTYESESWGMGTNILNGEDVSYTFNQSNFDFYNASDIPLRAEERPVIIRFNGDAPSGIKLRNETTGQEWNFYMSLKRADNLVINGLIPTKNAAQCYGNGLSDHGYIDFAPGHNKMTLTGATNFTVSFETRFYY